MLVGFKSKNHPQQRTDRNVDDRALMPDDFSIFNQRFRFSIDLAASSANAKLPRYYTEEDNSLTKSWKAERCYCNPPYSNLLPWIVKAWAEVEAEIIVLLIPSNRTEQAFWQDLVEPFRDRNGSPLRVEFLRGRYRFTKPGETSVRPNNRPPFGNCLLIFEHTPFTFRLPSDEQSTLFGQGAETP